MRRPAGCLLAYMAIALTCPLLVRAQAAADSTSRPPLLTWSYTGELVTNVAGGVSRGAVGLGVAGAQLSLSPPSIRGWKGTRLFVLLLGTHGGAPSELVGDVQGVSNLQAPPRIRLEEVWLQQNLLADRFSILVGAYDLNTEFYRVQSAGLFVNSSFGIGPELAGSGAGGPSIFPNTAVGSRVAVKPTANTVLRIAMLDGVPVHRPDGGIHLFAPGDGLLLVAEAALVQRPGSDAEPRHRRFQIGRGRTRTYAGKLAVGGWWYTAAYPDLVDTLASGGPAPRRGSRGAYLVGDQAIWSGRDGSPRVLSLFGEAGVGDGRVNQVGGYLGGGLTLAAPLVRRPDDEVGVAVASALIGSHARRQAASTGMPAANEIAIELTYALQLAGDVTLQPDVQYLLHPGGIAASRRAVVTGLRASVTR